MDTIEVKIYANAPVFVTASAESFGKLFAHMDDDEQIHVLRAMVEHMKPHQTQWDYIAIKLDDPENRGIVDVLRLLVPAERI